MLIKEKIAKGKEGIYSFNNQLTRCQSILCFDDPDKENFKFFLRKGEKDEKFTVFNLQIVFICVTLKPLILF